ENNFDSRRLHFVGKDTHGPPYRNGSSTHYKIDLFTSWMEDDEFGFIRMNTFIYIVYKCKDSHSCRMIWSEAILMVTKNVKFFKKCRQSEVKEFFKDVGKTGENRNRPVVREQGRVITFEEGKDLGCFELIWKNTLRK
ncbi:unnamed protein product, partial [Porites evermanni]